MRFGISKIAVSLGDSFSFIRREKLYVLLLIFVISANFSLSSLNNVFETSGLKVFEKEMPADKTPLEGMRGSTPVGKTDVSDQKIMAVVTSDPVLYLIFKLLFLVLIFFVIIGLAIDALFLYEKTADKNPIAATQSISEAKWGFWDICKVIIIFLTANVLISFAAIYAGLSLPPLPINRNLQLMLAATILDIVAVAAIFYFVLGRCRQSIASLGLTAKNVLLNIKYGVAAYIGLVPVFLGVTLLTTLIFHVLKIPVEPQQVVEILKEEKGLPSLIYMCLFASFLGPFMEEIFFRGFLYGVFKKKIGIFGGVLVSAVIFAYGHANAASFMPILSLGVLLAYIYEKTGSLVSSITAHAIHNSAMLSFLLFLKTIAR